MADKVQDMVTWGGDTYSRPVVRTVMGVHPALGTIPVTAYITLVGSQGTKGGIFRMAPHNGYLGSTCRSQQS